MAESFDCYNAPQFLDFEYPSHDDENADSYFDVVSRYRELNEEKGSMVAFRKSMSIGNLVLFNEQQHLYICEQLNATDTKPVTNKANICFEDYKEQKLEQKTLSKGYASMKNLNNEEKFVSLAESINTFQNKTPVRFKSRPKLTNQTALQGGGMYFDKSKSKSRPLHKKQLSSGSIKVLAPTEKRCITKPEPFSFESRNKMVQKKRQELINKILQEEKRAREFHAKPIPKNLKIDCVYTKSNKNDLDNGRKQPNSECLSTPFKAKVPTVLHKPPFEPKKIIKVTEIIPFNLNTERRAYEREEFEKQKYEKEQQMAYQKKLAEEQRLKKEQEEVAKLRKVAEFKAQPIKKYKPVNIQPSNKVTEPVSPKFLSKQLLHKLN